MEQLMQAPSEINLSGLRIVGGAGNISLPTPGSPIPSTITPPITDSPSLPSMPNLSAPASTGSNSAAPPSTGSNLSAPPSTGPNLDFRPSDAGLDGTTPQGAPSPVISTIPSSGSATREGIQDALSNLEKAPVQEHSGGSSALGFDPAAALAGLKKAPKREEPSGKTSGPLRFDPKAALAGLKKAPRKDEEDKIEETSKKTEFAEILDKRRKEAEDKVEMKEEVKEEEISAEEMKAQLQARLKSAFKK